MPIRTSLVEDNLEDRRFFSGLIERDPDFELIGIYSTASTALRDLVNNKPDIVIMDLFLDGNCENGLRFLRNVTALEMERRPRCVVLTNQSRPEVVFEAFRNGAVGYLLKSSKPGKILDGLREVHEGLSEMSAAISKIVIDYFQTIQQAGLHDDLSLLSVREREILRGISRGLTTRQLAETTQVQENTVRKHVQHILEKLNLNHRGEIIARYASVFGSKGPQQSHAVPPGD